MPSKFFELIKSNDLFDSHTHINTEHFDFDRADAVQRAEEKGLVAIFDMSIDYNSSLLSLEIADKFDTVFPSIGLHPEICQRENFDIDIEFGRMRSLILQNKEKLAMIGEIGLDYYWLEKDEELKKRRDELKEKQEQLFRKQLELAVETGLPVSIHSRGAIDQCIKIVSEYSSVRGVFHSLTLNEGDGNGIFYDQVSYIHDLNFLIGINGIYTFQGSQIEREVFMQVFRERGIDKEKLDPYYLYQAGFVFETDAPYLIPRQYKVHTARRNEPESVERIYEFVRKQFG